MMRLRPVDRDQPMLLPIDMKEWVSKDDLAHFVIAAVDRVSMSKFTVNWRGTGSEQYHPKMLLALMIYCYANGIYSSRRIERASYRDIGVRYISGNQHPDHATICAFRRNHLEALGECFVRVLEMAQEVGILKVGTVSIDGTKIAANASKHRNVRYDRAIELRKELEQEIGVLLEEAEAADKAGEQAGSEVPKRLQDRVALKEQLEAACERIERRNREKTERERANYEEQVAKRESSERAPRGRPPKEPEERSPSKDRDNLTDSDSRLMKQGGSKELQQAYNAQAVVDTTTMIVVGTRVSQRENDYNELAADVASIPEGVGTPTRVLADTGFGKGSEVEAVEEQGIEVLVALEGGGRQRRCHDLRPTPEPKEDRTPKQAWTKRMKERLNRPENRLQYQVRRQTVEPVFGIVKQAMGFRQFLRRGIQQVTAEWELVMLAYNCRRIHALSLENQSVS